MNVVQYLIQICHANVKAATNIGATALHIASENGHMDIVQYLITDGHADVEATTNRWYTVLDAHGFVDESLLVINCMSYNIWSDIVQVEMTIRKIIIMKHHWI